MIVIINIYLVVCEEKFNFFEELHKAGCSFNFFDSYRSSLHKRIGGPPKNGDEDEKQDGFYKKKKGILSNVHIL